MRKNTFTTYQQAKRQVEQIPGWNGSIKRLGGPYRYYYISGHAYDCKCGSCPVLLESGMMGVDPDQN